jgi:ribosomal protein S18 acetylase RimI-like enzyme
MSQLVAYLLHSLEMVSWEVAELVAVLTSIGFEQSILYMEGLYRWYLGINKSYDKLRLRQFWEVVEKHVFFADMFQFLELEVLVVKPAYQRQGLGSMMLAWGMDQASRRGLPIVVAATSSGKHLYQQHGFTECGSLVSASGHFTWIAMSWNP